MKILFVSYHYWPPNFGGELLVSIERFESLVERGHQVLVLTSGSPGFLDHDVVNGIEILRSPKVHPSKLGKGIRRLLFPIWVLRIIRKNEFDILHLAGTGGVGAVTSNIGNMIVCQAAQKKGAKLVYVHSLADAEREMYSEKGFEKKLRKLYLNKIDAIVSVSPALHEGVKKFYPRSSLFVPCGIRDDIFVPLSRDQRCKLRKENDVSEDQIVFTFLGSVGVRKGFDLIAKAFLELFDENFNWFLWIIGPNTKIENQNIKNHEVFGLIQELENKTSNVRMLGRLNDRKQLATLLAISDIFVFPSRKEGMGIAPLEAMAAGTPVIISKIPGVTDLANVEGETGLYINVGDLNSLKKAMLKLANHPELRAEMGKAATHRIHNYFGWQQHVTKWENLYLYLSDKPRK